MNVQELAALPTSAPVLVTRTGPNGHLCSLSLRTDDPLQARALLAFWRVMESAALLTWWSADFQAYLDEPQRVIWLITSGGHVNAGRVTVRGGHLVLDDGQHHDQVLASILLHVREPEFLQHLHVEELAPLVDALLAEVTSHFHE